jgi:putative nucleotidyltransferase with HDIG domain
MSKAPPRLVARTLTVTFITVAVILSVVFIVLTVDVRDRVRNAESEKLLVSERVFTALEARRQQEQLATIATLAENPTLKAALDTYFTESRFTGLAVDQELSLRATVAREADKLAALTGAHVLAIVDAEGRVFARAGPARAAWPLHERLELPVVSAAGLHGVVVVPSGTFLVRGAPLRIADSYIGALVIGTSLDETYARELADLASASIVIAVSGRVVASTCPPDAMRDFLANGETGQTRQLNGEEYAVRTLLASGPARIYALTSIDAAAHAATGDALFALGTIALGSFVLAALASLWLARTLAEPIDRVSRSIATITASRDFGRTIELTGTSRELDALAAAFNDLMRGLAAAEGETRSAYVGAIRALAAALDARDPCTAGHSERVSAVSVSIGRRMHLSDADLDVLRLGALLHDIGKIGVADEILRKPGPLTREEFEQIKRHPALGALILRKVPFLEPHLPIVELHHERPDGRGYPFGLRRDDIPLLARIVHVADAFDAMTSARAYRRAPGVEVALAELRRFKGTQFDPATVEALEAALPDTLAELHLEPELQLILGRERA